MSEENVLNEYMVKLGFVADQAQYRKFEATMKDASDIVTRHTSGMIKDMIGWQTAVIGGFTAVGLATLGMAEHVADADLNYQLLAMRMHTSVGVARDMDIALKAMGRTLNEVIWDPTGESQQRFKELLALQDKLATQMGPDTESGLRGVRDFEQEIHKLKVELFYLETNLTGRLFHEMDGEAVVRKLQTLNNWITSHLPEITKFFSQHLVPVLKDGESILVDTVGVVKDLALTFTNLIGLLSGDRSIEGTTFSFENFATAIDHVANGLADFVHWISSAEKMLTDLINTIIHALSLQPGAAVEDMKKLGHDSSLGGAGILGVGALGAYGAAKTGSGLWKWLRGIGGSGAAAGEGAEVAAAGAGQSILGGLVPVAGVGLVLGTLVNSWDRTESANNLRRWLGNIVGLDLTDAGAQRRDNELKRFFGMNTDSSSGPSGNAGSYHDQITAAARKLGIDPAFAHAIAMEESGEQQYDARGTVKRSKLTRMGYAKGIFQLEESTASDLGVDSADPSQNIKGGVGYLSQLLQRYRGNFEAAAAAYNMGPGNVDSIIRRHGQFSTAYLPRDVRDYVATADRNLEKQGVHIDSVTINIDQPGATHEQIHSAVSQGIYDGTRRRTQTNIASIGNPYQ